MVVLEPLSLIHLELAGASRREAVPRANSQPGQVTSVNGELKYPVRIRIMSQGTCTL